ncbi:hypothetical protein [Arthrobacter sp. Cr_A7]|uniref:hypothetical protein n=1 Tax=Arthrobacter sp. Cr_A7 TaxID=3031017 RepID=UPI0023DC094E|nr:hypothetical protein [Arthrobacter sp. Cr_A7]MDF2048870.1 hypothetical protein [Arthrobacter sp. Cr_A7]
MNAKKNGNQFHVDGLFAMEFAMVGQDEHGLPLLEVNFYPVLEGVTGSGWTAAVDGKHLVANATVPLEDTGLTPADLESLPLQDGWTSISTAHGAGLRVEHLEKHFGSRAALIILEALADALLSEFINRDLFGNPYRTIELNDNRYEEVLLMRNVLLHRIEADEQRQVTRNVFNALMDREFSI